MFNGILCASPKNRVRLFIYNMVDNGRVFEALLLQKMMGICSSLSDWHVLLIYSHQRRRRREFIAAVQHIACVYLSTLQTHTAAAIRIGYTHTEERMYNLLIGLSGDFHPRSRGLRRSPLLLPLFGCVCVPFSSVLHFFRLVFDMTDLSHHFL